MSTATVETPDVELNLPLKWNLEAMEKAWILKCLEAHRQNRTQTAKALGISPRTLQRYLLKWGLGWSTRSLPEKGM